MEDAEPAALPQIPSAVLAAQIDPECFSVWRSSSYLGWAGNFFLIIQEDDWAEVHFSHKEKPFQRRSWLSKGPLADSWVTGILSFSWGPGPLAFMFNLFGTQTLTLLWSAGSAAHFRLLFSWFLITFVWMWIHIAYCHFTDNNAPGFMKFFAFSWSGINTVL